MTGVLRLESSRCLHFQAIVSVTSDNNLKVMGVANCNIEDRYTFVMVIVCRCSYPSKMAHSKP